MRERIRDQLSLQRTSEEFVAASHSEEAKKNPPSCIYFVHIVGERLMLKLEAHCDLWRKGVKFTLMRVPPVASHTQQSWHRKEIRL